MIANQARPDGLTKLSGTIRNYKVTRGSANFVFTARDQKVIGLVAIAAALAELNGPATAAASSSNADEEADFVEFELDEKSVLGWLWRSPFKEGDMVDVAAEWRTDHYEASGIIRPVDRTIALYPHCSRGRASHVKNAVKWWFISSGLIFLFMALLFLFTFGKDQFISELFDFISWLLVGCYLFVGVFAVSMAIKWMVFVRLAEKVFKTLGLPDPNNVNLPKISKAQRKREDPGEFGTFYFRY